MTEKKKTIITLNRMGTATAEGFVQPHRDDELVDWIRREREKYAGSPIASSAYNALDALLDDYKLRADLGLNLTDNIPGEAHQ